jgi:predicted dehydrogenase
MTTPLRVGVIGLGPLWHKRYKPALAALRGRFQVAAVCDQIEHHAALEAKRLSCAAAPGPTDLLANEAVEAVLLLDPQWYKLWPVEAACRLGKPVFCCPALASDDAHADALYRQVRDSRLPLLMEMLPRATPALGLLQGLLATRLGPCRLLLGELVEARPLATEGGMAEDGKRDNEGSPSSPLPPFPFSLTGTGGLGGETALLDLGGSLLAGAPLSVQALGRDQTGLAGLVLEFPGGRALQISRYRAPRHRDGMRLQVVAERGTATVEFPHRLHWTDAAGSHTHVAPLERPPGQVLLEQFYGIVRDGRPPVPGLDEVYRLLGWVRAAARSRAEGRRINLDDPGSSGC